MLVEVQVLRLDSSVETDILPGHYRRGLMSHDRSRPMSDRAECLFLHYGCFRTWLLVIFRTAVAVA